MFTLPLTALALLIEAALGYPDALFRAIRHPVVWIGALISALDRHLNRSEWSSARRRAMGVVAVVVLTLVSTGIGLAIADGLQAVLPRWPALILEALLASSLFAQRSLYDHVRAVADALQDDGLAGGRRAVSQIVGRNPESLDEPGVCRAAIESLAENFADGVVSPMVWCAMFGLPGILFYKAINTADSMIGHRTPRHEAFGWAAARLDDLINLPGARVASIWIIKASFLCGADWIGATRSAWRDASKHRSPNAGWPEATMAGALGLRLAGPRIYGDVTVDDAWMGNGTPNASEADLRRALGIYRVACVFEIAVIIVLTLILRA